MTNNKLGIVARQEISYDLFEGILVTALEGGSNYWYMLDLNDTGVPKEKYAGEPLSVKVAKMIWYDRIDADDADVFFQIATMGEITFG